MNATLLITALISINCFSIKKDKEEIPPGTVKMAEGYFVDETEISNFNWVEYMYWHQKKFGKESPEYIATLPDTSVWGQLKELEANYLRHPGFRDFPVVGVSHQQAVHFCKWRSKMVNTYIYIRDNKVEYHSDSTYDEAPQLFQYRLPTEEEWKQMAEFPLTEKAMKKISKSQEEDCNFYKKGEKGVINMLKPNHSYYPNSAGVYNIYGNVAEMISEEGYVYGGSWVHFKKDAKNNNGIKYDQPTDWIGFRCVCDRVK